MPDGSVLWEKQVRDGAEHRDGTVLIGEDWIDPSSDDAELRASRSRRSFVSLKRSPLARKIITFNLLGLVILMAGVLYLDPGRDMLVDNRMAGLADQAELVADAVEAALPRRGPVNLATGDGVDATEALRGLDLAPGLRVWLFDTGGTEVAAVTGPPRAATPAPASPGGDEPTILTDAIATLWQRLTAPFEGTGTATDDEATAAGAARALADAALAGRPAAQIVGRDSAATVFVVATPVRKGEATVGAVALSSASGEIDALSRLAREQMLQVFVVALLVSLGLSLILASTIANPIADLAEAAEIGRNKNRRKVTAARVRIPDLSARPDEIGRLSEALRGMVGALYDRIDSNERFASDVAHEIKNPLASLRSAVGTLRVADTPDRRGRLYDVIEHDVRRLDRLVSDISNASRLDSELVREEEEGFDLIRLVRGIAEHTAEQAQEKGVEFIIDMPQAPIRITGLEARLAQVFVNLLTNAVSFCEEGDAVRVWARQREGRVIVVVEDTGPGIPAGAEKKIFDRFYTQRPDGQFGNHSGLGLAISKQIVEAHGGVIWAENITPTDADPTSEPSGARFVVGLPV